MNRLTQKLDKLREENKKALVAYLVAGDPDMDSTLEIMHLFVKSGVDIIEVGFPIAAALGLGWFIYKLIMRIVDGMETKLDTVDEKVNASISAMEERLGTKLDSQHGILVALIDRVRSLDNEIIRQDTLIKTILGVPQLIDSNKIAKADRDDQRKD